MFIIIYGNMVMRSVIEEKTNRIIEIIISSVKPFQLMIGKIIGTSLAGILQFLYGL
jgi:ABC-2 type transport system permease protein